MNSRMRWDDWRLLALVNAERRIRLWRVLDNGLFLLAPRIGRSYGWGDSCLRRCRATPLRLGLAETRHKVSDQSVMSRTT